jgi:GrpB-like predicted nucleotidyltransferase (UPF0157 family)
MSKGPVIIADYNPAWPRLFEAERDRIVAALGDKLVAVEHIGSTAAPGLGAKPIIDVMAGVWTLAEANACIRPLEALGYAYFPQHEATMPERRYFDRPGLAHEGGAQSYHVHMVEVGGEFWERHLLFRDYLRRHPETAREYDALKRRLAAQYGQDREGYTDAKSDFIRRIEAKARADGTRAG